MHFFFNAPNNILKDIHRNLGQMKHILKFTLLVFLFSSCGAAVKTYKKRTPTNNFAEVKVFNIQQDVPRDAEVLGKLKIGYNLYFRECNYDSVISKLKKEVRKIGGNTLKIIAHKPYHTPLSKDKSKNFIY